MNKKNLFAKIVMLKKIFERQRRTDSRAQNNQNIFKQKKSKNKNKKQFQQQSQQQNQSQNRFNQNIFHDFGRNTHAKNKRKRNENDQSTKSTCYRCHRKNHYVFDCKTDVNESNNQHIIVVVNVTFESKKNQASRTPRKRNKKNQ